MRLSARLARRADLTRQPADSTTTYLVKLDTPIEATSKMQDLAGLLTIPQAIKGIGDSDTFKFFCLVDGKEKNVLLSKCEERKPLKSTFSTPKYAIKDLSPISVAPTLGDFGPTLPQFRADTSDHTFLPMQNQYPVWYFFYNALADSEFLKEKLGLSELPVLKPAYVNGGIARSWGGKYKALFDGSAADRVYGWAYEVASKEHEDILRHYETDRYEVVRCGICLTESGESFPGLTFRFMDLPD